MSSRNNNQQAYDRGVSVFSPEGRIYQVEYAREAVQNGSPTVGLQTDSGVVLAAVTPNNSSLKVTGSVRKIHHIDDSLGAATTGYVPDGRTLVDNLRVTTQQEQLRYDENAKISAVAKQIGDHLQESTQVGGRRPYGASLIIGGVDDDGPSVYEVEPGGTPSEWLAVANGNRRSEFESYFQEHYEESLDVDGMIGLALDAFDEVSNVNVTSQTVDLASVEADEEQLVQHTEDDIETYL